MHSLTTRSPSIRAANSPQPAFYMPQFTPATRYYICRLLRQTADYESANLIAFKARLSVDHCVQLTEILHQTYPHPAELSEVIIKLDNLIYLYTTLNPEISLHPEHPKKLIQIERQIYQLLGFNET
jgi:hypothetical protein